MAEHAYTVVSDSETTGDEKPVSFAEPALGIDLGTSQCSVAFWNGSCVELLRNTRNQKLMRSYVFFNESPTGGVRDESGHDEQQIFSGQAIFNMKRLVGRMDTDPVVHSCKTLPFLVQTLGIGVRPIIAALVNNVWRSTTPEEVLAIFLLELRTMAEVQLKRAVSSVVLTIPVSFSRFQQTRIERSCAMAGLRVLRLMPEPTAVALLYAQQQQQQQQQQQENAGSGFEKVALLFNMGAGYCDVAVVATAGGVSQVKGLSGSAIGGEDMLQNVMRYLLPDFDTFCSGYNLNEIKNAGLLRVATQDAIHRLSSDNTVLVDVNLGNGSKVHKTLSREDFEKVNAHVFEACENLILQCVHDAKVLVEDIADVVLVGGCSSIPKIRQLVLGLCKKDASYTGIEQLEAAVCGAALEGAVASGFSDPLGTLDLLTIQVTPLTLGIRAEGDVFLPIVYRNTAIPARKDFQFTTAHDDQREALITVYEGEGKKASENHLLGFFKVTNIPPGPKGAAEITICMDVDASNVLRVMAGVLLHGKSGRFAPFIEVRMPTVDDGHGWCQEALQKLYRSKLDLVSAPRKLHQ